MWKLVLTTLAFSAQPDADWAAKESAHLKNPRQITKDFVRAGEGYFSPDGQAVIFQAEEKGENPFYQMYVQDLSTGSVRRVSTGVGKTTCGYFHPNGKSILFASSHLDPDAKKYYKPEFDLRDEEKKAKKRRRYVWDFDTHMEIFTANPDGSSLKRLTNSPGYDAEGSYSADGKHIVFCSNRTGGKNLELFIMNADGSEVRQLTKAPNCYNGGPFFSPDAKKVIFRSDRKKADHLQLYVINVDGTGERALTDDENWVFWAPYWYKDNRHIIYTAADHSDPTRRPNYDLYWMDTETGMKQRLSFAPGADVLPVFSPDYQKVMWTSNRDGRSPTQLYLADFVLPTKR